MKAPAEKKKTRPKMITASVAWFDGTKHSVEARSINPRWFAHKDEIGGWTLTHAPTGYAGGRYLTSFAKCQELVKAYEAAYPPARWTFTDPAQARSMTKCKAIARKHGINIGDAA